MGEREQRAAPPQRELGTARKIAFTAASVLFSFALLGAVELALRMVGIGSEYPLFVDAEGLPGLRHANPELMRRYLDSGGPPVAVIEPILFAAQKPADGYRIVVQGGSTAAGFPYGRWAGLAGMLGDRLEATFPERDIDVITTAMAAVNSHTLLDLVDEIIAISPDAVLVYAGHNEYLGVLGVGSALSVQNSRFASGLHLRLRRLRLYQLTHRIVTSLASVFAPAAPGDRNVLFAVAAQGALVPFGSAAYEAGIEQFEGNFDELLAKYARAGVPVYIGTLVSNAKDRPPFESQPLTPGDGAAWADAQRSVEMRVEEGDFDAARATLDEWIVRAPGSADIRYALGRLEERAGRYAEARNAYHEARDRDLLRFRAPEAFNLVVNTLAARHGARVVEVEQRFVEASPHGVPGRELLLEHVHPNADGYFLLADAYYEALRRDRRIGDWSRAPSFTAAQRDMPITAIDRVLAEYDLGELESGYPFTDEPRPFEMPPPKDDLEALAQRLRRDEIAWVGAMDALMQRHLRAGAMVDAARVARLVAQAYPTDAAPNVSAGLLYAELGEWARARRYLARGLRAAPEDPRALAALALASAHLGDRAKARAHPEALRQTEPEPPLLGRSAAPEPSPPP